MHTDTQQHLAAQWLNSLCERYPRRSTGSLANRQAAEFIFRTFPPSFHVEAPSFECVDWLDEGAHLQIGGESFPVQNSPFSLAFSGAGVLEVVSTLAELQELDAAGKIVLLCGEIAGEPFMPRNFPFFSVDEQQQIIALLEQKAPLALVTACPPSPGMSGGLYPAPLFEDGDFDIPSCYLSQEDGERLARNAGRSLKLELCSKRIPARANNVIARKSSANGDGAAPFLLFTAHLDSKPTTPGALDNAAGVVTLLLLAELLKEDELPFDVEIVAFNGEEYYSAPGEVAYLKQVQPRLKNLRLAVNLDGLGYVEGATHFSTYNLSPDFESALTKMFARYPGFQPGPQWYQGDHTIFVQQGLPVVALTCQAFAEAWSNFTHTPQDTPDKVDPSKLVEAAKALRELVLGGIS